MLLWLTELNIIVHWLIYKHITFCSFCLRKQVFWLWPSWPRFEHFVITYFLVIFVARGLTPSSCSTRLKTFFGLFRSFKARFSDDLPFSFRRRPFHSRFELHCPAILQVSKALFFPNVVWPNRSNSSKWYEEWTKVQYYPIVDQSRDSYVHKK